MSNEKKSSGIAKTLICCLVSLGAGAAGFWFYDNSKANASQADGSSPAVTKSAEKSRPTAAEIYEPIFLDIDPFTVTLRNDYDSRVLYTGMTLRVADKESKDRLVKYLPVVRSRILSELNTINPSRLNDQEEITRAKERIKQIVRAPITPERNGQYVDEVLFTSFESFLTQSEVDALLSDFSGEKPVESTNKNEESVDGIRAYDLGSTDRVVRRRMQTLELINERFARRLRTVFLNFMRRNADISVGPIQVLKYSEFERNLPVPSNLNVVKLNPLHGQALFAFDPTLVFVIIEIMFGGTVRSNTRIEGRDFTATELGIIRRLLNHTLEGYTQAWDGIKELEYSYVRSEMHTKFASITNSNELVVVTPVRIEFGSMGGSLNICLPYSMIEPIRDLLMNPYQDSNENAEDSRWSDQMSKQIRHAEVELIAHFAELNLSIGDLMKLEKGSIIPCDLSDSITAYVNEVPALKCGYGIANKRYALEVNEHLQVPSFEYFPENKDV